MRVSQLKAGIVITDNLQSHDGTLNMSLTELKNLDSLTAALSSTEWGYINGVTAGTVTASKAVVVDASKDIGDFRNVDVVNLDAGASGTAGTIDVFPTTASKGKLALAAVDNDGDTTTTISNAAMGQASVVSIPDPGAATANFMLTDAANDGVVVTATAAEITAKCDDSVIAAKMTAGTGADGADDIQYSVERSGNIITTKIYIDFDGLNCGGTAGDIIGEDGGVANAHFGQITAAVNGTIIGGWVDCIETPTGGDTDIDLYSATEGTGAEDAAITGLAETQLLNSGGLSIGSRYGLTAYPAADEYLYLVGQTGGDATYTAGKVLITLIGKGA